MILKIGAPHRSAAAFAAGCAHEITEEKVSENIAEIHEQIGIDSGKSFRATVTAKTLMAVFVVNGSFVTIAQHTVGFGRFLEAFFGLMISGIFIRMIFDRHFAVGALDFLL